MTHDPLHPALRARQPLFDFLWLLALSIYLLAGISLTSFHGDEAMQMSMGRDFAAAFLEGQPQRLQTSPPYFVDSEQHLRLINGSVNRYTIGLSWWLSRFPVDDLPQPPGWDWGLTYEQGVETGHRPTEAELRAARLPSALFLCASLVPLFALGLHIGGRRIAYSATALYALNPVILLNGRRAIQESSMLFFGLLVVAIAAHISRKRASSTPVSPLWWALFAAAGSFALASKHSGVVFIAGAFAWLLVSELLTNRQVVRLGAALALSALLTVAGFIALSPALWNDPLARAGDLMRARAELISLQVAFDENAPTTLPRRLLDIVREPFISPVAHYELVAYGSDPTFQAEIARYMASPLSGVQLGLVLGGIVTALSVVGALVALPGRRQRPAYAGLHVWLLLTAAYLMVNPLPWQRYYLPLIPISTLLVGVGVLALVEQVRRMRQPSA